MNSVLTARCPAKINLALHVVDRRPDGFHELDTIFQAVDLWDTLSGRPAGELSLTSDDPSIPCDGTNLVLRAARLLLEETGVRAGAELHLAKSIPVAGGLGGGSSDAAAALLLCSRLWRVEPGEAALREMAGRLGADVPFFLLGGTARGRGRGDLLEPLPHPGPMWLVLGCPPFGVSTPAVFAGVTNELTLPGKGVSLAQLSSFKCRKGKDFGFMVNDLEAVVFPRWPELRGFRDALLDAGAEQALLSGSGSTVYGVFEDREKAAGASGRLESDYGRWRLTVTRIVDRGVRITAR